MVDPLAEVVTLLQPRAPFAKLVSGAGRWSVRRADAGRPFYCVILDGASRLAVGGHPPVILEKGDFVLIPAAFDFRASSLEPTKGKRDACVVLPDGEVRHGNPDGPPDVRMLVGDCVFGSPDAGLLVSLLPQFVLVRGEPRLATLVQLVRDEYREWRPAREVILARLLEVLLIEALRSTAGTAASPGLVRGLADERLAVALRRMHESPTAAWTSPGWRRRPRSPARRSSSASAARSASPRWPTCSAGAWPWPRTCCAGRKATSPRSPSASATARRARSASPSPAMSACRRRGMQGSRRMPDEYSAFSVDGRTDRSMAVYNPATAADAQKIGSLIG